MLGYNLLLHRYQYKFPFFINMNGEQTNHLSVRCPEAKFTDQLVKIIRLIRLDPTVMNRRLSRCFQRDWWASDWLHSSKQCWIELLYRYKQAKTSRIAVLNIRKLYVYNKRSVLRAE